MSISNINGPSGLGSISSVSNEATTQSSGRASSIPPSPATATTISKPGELFGKLSQLAQQDAAAFKQIAQSTADQLKTAAQGASGPRAQFLNDLAGKFSQAASTGDASVLQPADNARAAGGHHHHHHHGAHATSGGAAGGIEAVLGKALDQVNQALSGSTAAQPTAGTPLGS